MRILLTGATGFIGAHVARALLDAHLEVHALVLAGERSLLDPRAAAVTGDLTVLADVDRAIDSVRPEVAVHLAWYANPKDYLVSRENTRLLAASVRLGEVLLDAGCKRLVGVGTCLEYDTRTPGPYAETHATSPQFLYSACKRALFDIWSELAKSAQATLAWARVFWLYGPGERPVRLVPAVAQALARGEEARVSTGEQVRDFLHVADVASGIAHLVTHPTLTGAYNVASGEPVRVKDVVAAIARIVGREDLVRYGAFPTRPGEPPSVFADATKLRTSGWAPRFTLEAGLRDAINSARQAE